MRWLIGDIHGMYAALDAIVNAVGRRDPDARFIFVGDYVNRGPDSRRVIDYLLAMDPARTRLVRGNHDDVLDLILNEHWFGGERETFHPLAACEWFLKHGLYDTLASYGLKRDRIDYLREQPDGEMLDAIRNAFPVAHKKFLYQLPVVIEDADLFVAHAFWPPQEMNDAGHVADRVGAGDDAELLHRVIWERFTTYQVLADKPWTRPGFFGHTPVSNYPDSLRGGRGENVPINGPMITLLDTAIALGSEGRLSAVSAEDGQLVQVDRVGRTV